MEKKLEEFYKLLSDKSLVTEVHFMKQVDITSTVKRNPLNLHGDGYIDFEKFSQITRNLSIMKNKDLPTGNPARDFRRFLIKQCIRNTIKELLAVMEIMDKQLHSEVVEGLIKQRNKMNNERRYRCQVIKNMIKQSNNYDTSIQSDVSEHKYNTSECERTKSTDNWKNVCYCYAPTPMNAISNNVSGGGVMWCNNAIVIDTNINIEGVMDEKHSSIFNNASLYQKHYGRDKQYEDAATKRFSIGQNKWYSKGLLQIDHKSIAEYWNGSKENIILSAKTQSKSSPVFQSPVRKVLVKSPSESREVRVKQPKYTQDSAGSSGVSFKNIRSENRNPSSTSAKKTKKKSSSKHTVIEIDGRRYNRKTGSLIYKISDDTKRDLSDSGVSAEEHNEMVKKTTKNDDHLPHNDKKYPRKYKNKQELEILDVEEIRRRIHKDSIKVKPNKVMPKKRPFSEADIERKHKVALGYNKEIERANRSGTKNSTSPEREILRIVDKSSKFIHGKHFRQGLFNGKWADEYYLGKQRNVPATKHEFDVNRWNPRTINKAAVKIHKPHHNESDHRCRSPPRQLVDVSVNADLDIEMTDESVNQSVVEQEVDYSNFDVSESNNFRMKGVKVKKLEVKIRTYHNLSKSCNSKNNVAASKSESFRVELVESEGPDSLTTGNYNTTSPLSAEENEHSDNLEELEIQKKPVLSTKKNNILETPSCEKNVDLNNFKKLDYTIGTLKHAKQHNDEHEPISIKSANDDNIPDSSNEHENLDDLNDLKNSDRNGKYIRRYYKPVASKLHCNCKTPPNSTQDLDSMEGVSFKGDDVEHDKQYCEPVLSTTSSCSKINNILDTPSCEKDLDLNNFKKLEYTIETVKHASQHNDETISMKFANNKYNTQANYIENESLDNLKDENAKYITQRYKPVSTKLRYNYITPPNYSQDLDSMEGVSFKGDDVEHARQYYKPVSVSKEHNYPLVPSYKKSKAPDVLKQWESKGGVVSLARTNCETVSSRRPIQMHKEASSGSDEPRTINLWDRLECSEKNEQHTKQIYKAVVMKKGKQCTCDIPSYEKREYVYMEHTKEDNNDKVPPDSVENKNLELPEVEFQEDIDDEENEKEYKIDYSEEPHTYNDTDVPQDSERNEPSIDIISSSSEESEKQFKSIRNRRGFEGDLESLEDLEFTGENVNVVTKRILEDIDALDGVTVLSDGNKESILKMAGENGSITLVDKEKLVAYLKSVNRSQTSNQETITDIIYNDSVSCETNDMDVPDQQSLQQENDDLEQENDELQQENDDLQQENDDLEQENDDLQQENDDLQQENDDSVIDETKDTVNKLEDVEKIVDVDGLSKSRTLSMKSKNDSDTSSENEGDLNQQMQYSLASEELPAIIPLSTSNTSIKSLKVCCGMCCRRSKKDSNGVTYMQPQDIRKHSERFDTSIDAEKRIFGTHKVRTLKPDGISFDERLSTVPTLRLLTPANADPPGKPQQGSPRGFQQEAPPDTHRGSLEGKLKLEQEENRLSLKSRKQSVRESQPTIDQQESNEQLKEPAASEEPKEEDFGATLIQQLLRKHEIHQQDKDQEALTVAKLQHSTILDELTDDTGSKKMYISHDDLKELHRDKQTENKQTGKIKCDTIRTSQNHEISELLELMKEKNRRNSIESSAQVANPEVQGRLSGDEAIAMLKRLNIDLDDSESSLETKSLKVKQYSAENNKTEHHKSTHSIKAAKKKKIQEFDDAKQIAEDQKAFAEAVKRLYK